MISDTDKDKVMSLGVARSFERVIVRLAVGLVWITVGVYVAVRLRAVGIRRLCTYQW